MKALRSFLVCIALLPAARGESWTNAAGHAFEAKAVSLEGQRAEFALPTGEALALHLNALAPPDRQRLRDRFELYEIAEPLRPYQIARRQLGRLGKLRELGRIESGEYRDLRRNIVEGFQKTARQVQASHPALTARHISEAVVMLRKN